MKKGYYKGTIIRVAWIALSIILQLALWIGIFFLWDAHTEWSMVLLTLFTLICITYILREDDYAEVKISWIVFLVALPLTGLVCYLFLHRPHKTKKQKQAEERRAERLATEMRTLGGITLEEGVKNPYIKRQMQYLQDIATSPVQSNTQTTYYGLGEEFLASFLDELRGAQRFIFLEYFTIEEGEAWSQIEAILIAKAAQGVDVRVLYDEAGNFFTLTPKFSKYLEKHGVSCLSFNAYSHILNASYNNRDHRKICVIDGNVGFTGGINLSDCYFNITVRHGHWKDTALKLQGDGVYNLTVMFLSMWESVSKVEEHYPDFLPTKGYVSDGLVQPFYDDPCDDNPVGETIYMSMLNMAHDYVYITTPYLIISRERKVALTTAAKSGVQVKMILPGVPDKKMIQFVSRSYYKDLIKAGVEIYEYTPGFVHAKMFISDDESAVIGTINLDYRSLMLHYECGVWLYQNSSVMDMKEDFLETLTRCTPITENPLKARGLRRFINFLAIGILRVLAPLL